MKRSHVVSQAWTVAGYFLPQVESANTVRPLMPRPGQGRCRSVSTLQRPDLRSWWATNRIEERIRCTTHVWIVA